jgi:diguanylate cyclase (GGDEF)-like protein
MSASAPTVLVYEFAIDSGEPIAALLGACPELAATVTIASDEAGALGMCRTGRVDGVVLGQDCTIAEALGLAARLRRVGATATPAIVLVAREDDEPAAFAAAGALDIDDYVVRAGLNRWRLAQTVRAAIGRRTLRRELVEVGAELERAAQTDPLTGLANARLFHERLDHAVEIALRRQTNICLIVLDIEGFRRVNDLVGRRHGDAALKEVGRRLAGLGRKSDTIARIGDDEFAFVMETGSSVEGARLVAERILEQVRAPIEVAGRKIVLDGCVGISILGAQNGEMAVRQAGQALTAAKSEGGGWSIYAPPPARPQRDREAG